MSAATAIKIPNRGKVNKMKKRIIAAVILVVMCVGLVSCAPTKLNGKYYSVLSIGDVTQIWEFKRDGTYTVEINGSYTKGTYTYDKDTESFDLRSEGDVSLKYTVTIDDEGNLTLRSLLGKKTLYKKLYDAKADKALL